MLIRKVSVFLHATFHTQDRYRQLMDIKKDKDELARKTQSHEFYRCTDSFISFNYHLKKELNSKKSRILCYNAYTDFLAHLYKFYLKGIEKALQSDETGFYKNYASFKNLGNLKRTDIILKEEVEKLMRNRKNRILRGYVDNLSFDISFYEQTVPKEFGQHLRFIRNRRNHVDSRRLINSDISLVDFYKKYHNFVVILYKEAFWLWNNINDDDDDSFDLKEVENFAKEIKLK